MSPGSAATQPARVVREARRPESPFALFALEAWEERWPGLRAGITAAGEDADFGLATAGSAWTLLERFEALGRQLGFLRVAVGRQVHGAEVTCLERGLEPGVRVPGETDGLVTDADGLLLAVTAADCIPVYLAHPSTGGLGLLHAGWRGLSSGVLESGVRAMEARFGAEPAGLHVHLGAGICGECYEVGPEVLRALGREAGEGGSARVDLRGELARRAVALGVTPGSVTRSGWCSRCDADHFHSHRGTGERAGRMAAFLGRAG